MPGLIGLQQRGQKQKQNQGAQTHIRSALSVTSSGLLGLFAIQERLILCSCRRLTAKRVRPVTDNIRRANQSFNITSHSDYAKNRIMSTVLLRWKMFWYYESLEVSTTLIFHYHMFLLDFILKKARFQANKKKKDPTSPRCWHRLFLLSLVPRVSLRTTLLCFWESRRYVWNKVSLFNQLPSLIAVFLVSHF